MARLTETPIGFNAMPTPRSGEIFRRCLVALLQRGSVRSPLFPVVCQAGRVQQLQGDRAFCQGGSLRGVRALRRLDRLHETTFRYLENDPAVRVVAVAEDLKRVLTHLVKSECGNFGTGAAGGNGAFVGSCRIGRSISAGFPSPPTVGRRSTARYSTKADIRRLTAGVLRCRSGRPCRRSRVVRR